MKDLLLYIARNLVDDPDSVSVTEVQGDQELTLELRVAPDDMGKVIGRQGRIAKEIRCWSLSSHRSCRPRRKRSDWRCSCSCPSPCSRT